MSNKLRNLLPLSTAVATAFLLGACSAPAVTPEAPIVTSSPVAEKYPAHTVTATGFWIGEPASDDNFGIDNISTEWEDDARRTFGGTDSPRGRKFIPKENSYYFALPISEFDEEGVIKGVREASPWNNEKLPDDDSRSLFKGRWIKVTAGDQTAYGQMVDSGPSNDDEKTDDLAYVFGSNNAQPKNHSGEAAGIDLSPDLARAVGFNALDGSATVTWSFIDTPDVPDGAWKQYPAIDNRTHWK